MFSRRRITSRTLPKQSVVITAALALVVGPLAVIGGNAAVDLIQDNGTGPIDAVVQNVSLADSASVLVEDAAIATQSLVDDLHPNRGVVKEITSDTEFSQFALTWTGSADIASFVRAQRADGTWSEWFAAEPQYPSDDSGNGLNGTELIYVEPTKKVQVSTHGLNIFGPDSGVNVEDIRGAEGLDLEKLNLDLGDTSRDSAPSESTAEGSDTEGIKDEALKAGADIAEKVKGQLEVDAPASETTTETSTETSTEPTTSKAPGKWTDIVPVADELPLNQVEAVLIDGNAAASAIDPIVDAKNVTGMPKVITRAGWGANESNRCQDPEYDDELLAATVHHTAGSNNYTQAQAAGLVRGIYQYHAQTLGWCDIGYNALVDKFGNIYEGRYGGLDKNVQGAHAGGFNESTFGISMMGDYSIIQPSQATINAVGNMIGWRLKVAGVNPSGKTTLVSGGTHYSKYAYGQSVTLPNIFAHRDTGNTTCPGDAGYAQMSTIRSIAQSKYSSLADGKIDNEAPSGLTDLLVQPNDGTSSSSSSSTESSADSSATSGSSETSSKTSSVSDVLSSLLPSSSKNSTTASSSATSTKTSTAATGSSATTAEPTSNESTSSESVLGADSTTDSSTDPNAAQQKADTVEAVTGARSMLASALGLLGAPGLGATADAILGSVGRSIENGPSIDDLPVLIDKILAIDEKNDLAAEWRAISEKFGSVLGNAESGVQNGSTVSNESGIADTLRYVKFDNGVITSSKTTGTHALWGDIADAWAKQGFEVGELGAPTKSQTVSGNTETAEFQNGTITHDTVTGETKVTKK